MFKRILSTTVAAIILLCGMTVNAFAAEQTAVESITDFLQTAALKNAEIRTSDDKRNAFNVSGRTYYEGVILKGYDAEVSFNVESIDQFSFTVGCANAIRTSNDSGYENAPGTWEFYLDDKFYDSVDIMKPMNLTSLEFDVSGASVFRIVQKLNFYDQGCYALVNLKADELTGAECDIPDYSSTKEFISGNFLSNYMKVQTADDSRNAFRMNGRTYYEGILLTTSGGNSNYFRTCLNVENIDTLSFTIGCVSDSNDGAANLEIYLDNVYYKTVSLTRTMNLTDVSIDVSKVSVILFAIKKETHEATYGLANFQIDAVKGPDCLIPEYIDIPDFMQSGFGRSNTEIRTSDDKRNAFNVSGRTYYEGVILKGYDAEVSFNVESIDQFSFTVGCANAIRTSNDSGYENAPGTWEFYLDDKFYDSVDIMKPMNLTSLEFDVSGASVFRIVQKLNFYDQGCYALVNLKADELTGAECDIPVYASTEDFIRSAFLSCNTEIRTSDDTRNVFTMNGEIHNEGILLKNSGSNVQFFRSCFNVENIGELRLAVGCVNDTYTSSYNKEANLNIYVDEAYYGNVLLSPDMELTKVCVDVSKASTVRFAIEKQWHESTYGLADFKLMKYKTGDLSGNTEIEADDAQMTLKAYVNVLAGKDTGLTDEQKEAADIDGDGEITATDAQIILRYYVNRLAGKDVTWEELLLKK